MTPNLRKRHFRTWMALAVLIPVGFVWAFISIPPSPPSTSFAKHPAQPTQLEKLVKEADHQHLKINLREDRTGTKRQLEIIVKAPLNHPSTWVYLGTDSEVSIEGKKLVGILANQGVYRFPIDAQPDFSNIILYDAIKKESWTVIEL